ncbi:NfeD family protein [Candidatus Manganitrophus noduliformans]|uniref:Nodulation protein NfeD n=1 Tax=Candidatus Manganitrophus noduliformans TaxID=2606439 RepID=A0A7X6IC38_9BACT|nr:nodulation protein NfeD [Candidatus Manganitrophus noduliformans]NKE72416.1 nodulation protein NfeD [Candidatus Manganitrophus noduliformans]
MTTIPEKEMNRACLPLKAAMDERPSEISRAGQGSRRRRARLPQWRAILFGLLALLIPGEPLGQPSPAENGRPVVYLAPIEGIIDLGLAPFVNRVLEEAAGAEAAAVIFEINTFGGRVDAAVVIRDALLNAPIQTVAFINKRAISAGALISLAAEKIAMADGGTIGAATPVQVGQPGAPAQPVEEKTVSYVRKEFRATAESRKRPLLVAEAMVDADVEIPGIIEKGKLLTLTTEEAMEHGVADFRANTLESVLEQLELPGAEVKRATPNWAERLVRLLTHPVLSSLLITVAMLGIILELRTPGFGIPGGLGIASLALFFWGHWLVQLAGWEEILLVVSGLVLLVMEIFVIPGFGVAGVLGIAALLGGLSLSVIGAGATWAFILKAVGRVVFSLFIALGASLLLLRLLPRLPFGRRLILETGLGAGEGYTSAPESDRGWLGKKGIALSPLRPAGIAEIEEERVDVVSDGELIEAGQPIKVIRVDGNRIVVRRLRTSTERSEHERT